MATSCAKLMIRAGDRGHHVTARAWRSCRLASAAEADRRPGRAVETTSGPAAPDSWRCGLPTGWTVRGRHRSRSPLARRRPSAAHFRFAVTIAVARRAATTGYRRKSPPIGGSDYTPGLRPHRAPRISRPAISITRRQTSVRGVDVRIAPGLKGRVRDGDRRRSPGRDRASSAPRVTLARRARTLASGDLGPSTTTIMTGTRALRPWRRRSQDIQSTPASTTCSKAATLIVLYNTQEFVPNLYAPFPAQLPGQRAEEVSRRGFAGRDSRARRTKAFTTPNQITKADFDGWIEQRGSKVLHRVGRGVYADDRHATIRGQEPQRGRLGHGDLRQGALIRYFRLRLPPPANRSVVPGA